jgi:acyl dehydratase
VAGKSAKDVERRVSGEYRRDIAPVERARPGLEPGTPIVPLVKRANPEQMSVFSMISPFSKNIHTDLEAAEAAGLRLPIMQGQQQVCFIAELLTNFFGASWFTSGWEKVKFISPLYTYDSVTARGAVTGEVEEEEGTRLELEVWVENEAGEMTAVGWASALVDNRDG